MVAGLDHFLPLAVFGSMRFGDWIFVPYGISDMGARIATVKVDDLLSALSPS